MLDGCYELPTPANGDDLRTKGRTIMYRAIVVAFCFAIVFAGLLLFVGRVDTFTGYQLICLTPQG